MNFCALHKPEILNNLARHAGFIAGFRSANPAGWLDYDKEFRSTFPDPTEKEWRRGDTDLLDPLCQRLLHATGSAKNAEPEAKARKLNSGARDFGPKDWAPKEVNRQFCWSWNRLDKPGPCNMPDCKRRHGRPFQ